MSEPAAEHHDDSHARVLAELAAESMATLVHGPEAGQALRRLHLNPLIDPRKSLLSTTF